MVRGTFRIRRTTILGVEAVEAETTHVFPKHTHDQFGIGVIRRGAQKSLSGRGVVEAGQGNVITVNPGEVHDGMPIGDRGRMWTMLYFDPQVILDAANDVSDVWQSQELHHPVLNDGMAAGNFLRLYTLVAGDDRGSAIESESLLLCLVDRLMSERAVRPANGFPQSLCRAQALIDDAPTDDLTLGDLARVSGFSRFQVLRGFTKMTGLTPHAYLMQKRADLARCLIRGKMPLAEVAAASGFADQSHMTRIFASKYGVTPGSYAAAVG
jgi:AraC-like DNA-binding protein